MFKWSKFIIASLLALFSVQVLAADISGVIKITKKGKAVSSKEYNDVIVYFVPDDKSLLTDLKLETKEVVMKKKTFVPRVLPITVGSSVNFPNFDPILHNAFSTSKKNKFDLGLIGQGDTSEHLFNKPGLVRVYCNVHHSMVAYVLIFDTPFYSYIKENGEFNMKNIPSVEGNFLFGILALKFLNKN